LVVREGRVVQKPEKLAAERADAALEAKSRFEKS
jgi:hypothetical protein